MSAEERFSSSKQRLMKTPREYSMVPMAPSATNTRRDSCSRNSLARLLLIDVLMGETGVTINFSVLARGTLIRRRLGMQTTGRRAFLAGMVAAAAAAQERYVPKQSDRPEPATGDEPGFKPIFDGKSLD